MVGLGEGGRMSHRGMGLIDVCVKQRLTVKVHMMSDVGYMMRSPVPVRPSDFWSVVVLVRGYRWGRPRLCVPDRLGGSCGGKCPPFSQQCRLMFVLVSGARLAEVGSQVCH